MSRAKQVAFCGVCDATYPARRKLCMCGLELQYTTAPAHLECGHCGDVAITSTHGIFYEDEGVACEHCLMPGRVAVDDGCASWVVDDDSDANVCNRPDCEECKGHLAKVAAQRGAAS